jgi:hypothetical protein
MFQFVLRSILGLFFLAFAQVAHAESGDQRNASISNPGQFLGQFPSGGRALVSTVRDLLTSDKSTLSTLIRLLPYANGDQQTAIADGLAEAAKIYLRSDPACAVGAPQSPGTCFATQIQQAVATSGNPDFIKAYASIAGDTGTASTGGGGGGGGGQTGNNTPSGGTNTGFLTLGQHFPNNFQNLFTGAVASGASVPSSAQ